MSDDAKRIEPTATTLPKKRKRTVRPVRVALFSGLLLVVAAALLLLPEHSILDLDGIRRTITYRNYEPVAVPTGSGAVAFFSEGFAAADGETFRLLSGDGTEQLALPTRFSCPKLSANGASAMLYDAGGNQLLLASADAAPSLRKTDGLLLDAELSAQRLCSVLVNEAGQTELCVETLQDQSVRHISCPQGYLTLCAANEDGSCIAAVCCRGSGAVFESAALLYKSGDTQPCAEVPLGDRLISDLRFLDETTLCAVGADRTTVLKSDGTQLGLYSYGSAELEQYTLSSEGICLVLREDGNELLVSLDKDGRLLKTLSVPEITAIDSCGKYLAYAAGNQLTVCRRDLSVYAQTEETKQFNAVNARSDGTVMAVSGGTAQLYFYH